MNDVPIEKGIRKYFRLLESLCRADRTTVFIVNVIIKVIGIVLVYFYGINLNKNYNHIREHFCSVSAFQNIVNSSLRSRTIEN